MERNWIAVVICKGEKRTLASFLTLTAWNRRKALQKLREELPNNSEYLDTEGNLRPFTLLELKQVHPSEEGLYMAAFLEMMNPESSRLYPSEEGMSA